MLSKDSTGISGYPSIRATLGAVKRDIAGLQCSFSDDGDGGMIAPDGRDENDLSLLMRLRDVLEAAL